MADEQDCIDALRDAARELGESPTKAEYESLGVTPASATIQRVMGGWNAAKEAAGLETNPSTGSRTLPKPDDVDLPEGADWESLSVDQRWHYRNRTRNAERSLQRRRELRAWLATRKREAGGCERCAETDPQMVDFHHPDPDAKQLAVNEMVTMGQSREAIRAEAEDCTLLCANCHAKEHVAVLDAEDATSDRERLRVWTRIEKRVRGCPDCGETDPRCLEFHHVDEKSAAVSRLVSDGANAARVRAEAAACEVVCANCHRRRHDVAWSGESDRI